MKNILLLIIISVAVIVNSGCASKLLSFEKRKYNKGYHVDLAKKNEKNRGSVSSNKIEHTAIIEAEKITSEANETTYSPLPEIQTTNTMLAEETIILSSVEKSTKVKNKFFQNPILKYFTGSKIKTTAKYCYDKLVFKKNTAGTNQTNRFNYLKSLGATIGGGSLLTLSVMLFSNWATVALLISLVSGCILGLILLIVGANT